MKATLGVGLRPTPAAALDRRQRLLEAPILPTLLRLAVPSVVLVVVQALSSTIDAFYLGRLGPTVLAGVALVFPVWMLMVTTSAGALGGGISSSVARALGASRRRDADALVTHSLLLASAVGLAFSAVVLLGGPWLYRALGGDGPALAPGLAYSRVIFGGAVCVWWVNALASLLRGSGQMLVPAGVIVGGELLHLALAPLLIFGLGPFPPLGVVGGAASLIASYALRALVLGVCVFGGRGEVRLPEHALRPRLDLVWDVLRVAVPGSVNTLMTNVNVMLTTSLVAPSGVLALAGYGLAARLEYLQIPLVFGFGTAVVTLVGTNIGAGQVDRARRIAWAGAGVAAAVTGSVGVLVAVAPDAWLGLFSADPAVLSTGETYLRIVGPTYALFGLGLALYFAAQGAGRLLPALLAGLARLLIVASGGWLVVHALHADLVWLFGAIGLAFVVFGSLQALAINRVIGPTSAPERPQTRM